MGATLKPPPGTPPGLDADLFDAHCEHLIVRTLACDDAPSQVVGTYRVLTPPAAKRLGALYSDGEFDLVRLRQLRPHLAELGRSCTDPQWRQGGVILTLWSSLGEFLQRNGLQGVIGCASVSMRDGGHQAAALWHQLRQTRLVAPDMQVRPRRPLPLPPVAYSDKVETPPLIKGYLRCGAQVLGPPAWDPDFGTADLPMMMRLVDLPAAYKRRFIDA
jgi:putative hemolysin